MDGDGFGEAVKVGRVQLWCGRDGQSTSGMPRRGWERTGRLGKERRNQERADGRDLEWQARLGKIWDGAQRQSSYGRADIGMMWAE